MRPVLTPLEREILQRMAGGLSSREVAARLGVPVGIVRSALGSIIKKLGAGSKLEVIVVAIRQALILPPS
jgi:DNA-binding CsgD family transcriptional regulator